MSVSLKMKLIENCEKQRFVLRKKVQESSTDNLIQKKLQDDSTKTHRNEVNSEHWNEGQGTRSTMIQSKTIHTECVEQQLDKCLIRTKSNDFLATKQNNRKSFYDVQTEIKKEQSTKRLKAKRSQYCRFMSEMDKRKETFGRFTFKSYEKDENPCLAPLIQKVNQIETRGSMNVIDLWQDTALKQYLNFSHLKDGKYMLRGIAQQANYERTKQGKEQPTIFTKKDEIILKEKLHDSKQIDSVLKDINKNFKRKSQINDKNLKALLHKKTEIKKDAQDNEILPFNEEQFIKKFFQSSEVIPLLSLTHRKSILFQQNISKLTSPSAFHTTSNVSQYPFSSISSPTQLINAKKKPSLFSFAHDQLVDRSQLQSIQIFQMDHSQLIYFNKIFIQYFRKNNKQFLQFSNSKYIKTYFVGVCQISIQIE